MLHLPIIQVFLLAMLPMPALSGDKLTKEEKEWLYRVDFIITTEERREFRKRLSSGYERSKFIDLFWAKRDPDLSDNVNPFKDEYLARYDYVMTNYEKGRYNIPKDDRSFIYMMLGKPSKIEPRIDITIMGPEWRNKYLQHRPELWTYESMDYEYKRQKLRIQLIPTSTFGDYVAYMDNYSINWLRRVKYKFIVNPDLEVAPASSAGGGDGFRNVVSLEQQNQVEEPLAAMEEDGENLEEADSEPEQPARTEASLPPENKAAAAIEAELKNEEKQPPPSNSPLTVPTPVAAPRPDNPRIVLNERTGNPLGLQARMGYFMNGSNQTLLLIRMGFPISDLNFQFQDNQYRAPFTMRYVLENDLGKVLQSDSIQGDINLPDLEVIKKKETWYSRELAATVNPDRYLLKVELLESGSPRISYFETELEVPPLNRNGLTTSQLCFMDPNVDPKSSSFSVAGKAYGFYLPPTYGLADRLFPIIEIFGKADEDSLDSIQMSAIQNGKVVHTWVLYPEEMTPTSYGTVLVHPELRINTLKPGTWSLQFEMELPNGDLLLSESQFIIEGPSKSR